MSFVTTPMRCSSRSSPQRAAIRLLLPDPTGPPIPTRSARSGSAGKEALLAGGMDRGGELDADRGGRRLLPERPPVRDDRARDRVDLRRQLGDPARGLGGIEAEQ